VKPFFRGQKKIFPVTAHLLSGLPPWNRKKKSGSSYPVRHFLFFKPCLRVDILFY
jgi:hypothetical protein